MGGFPQRNVLREGRLVVLLRPAFEIGVLLRRNSFGTPRAFVDVVRELVVGPVPQPTFTVLVAFVAPSMTVTFALTLLGT